MKVLYTGALFNSSGYAEAARNNIAAILTQPDIELSARAVSFENWATDIGPKFNDMIQPLLTKKVTPDVQIIHLTPENFARTKQPGMKNIGYTVWEASKLPSNWVDMCNQLDEIWVPCQWNVDVFKSSGVTVPIRKIPHTINLSDLEQVPATRIDNIPTDVFNFYSIFHWSSRKNPEGLLKAYLAEFRNTDKVNLVLKTYMNDSSTSDRNQTVLSVGAVKKSLELQDKETASITLVHGALSKQQMSSLHRTCDCFVLPHRAEGWGVPHFEAMALGKPVITTGFGGNLEFMNADTSYLLSFDVTPVSGTGRHTYNGWMDWAEPSIANLRYWMRYVYEHQEEIPVKVAAGREKIQQFDWLQVGKLIRESL